MSARHAPKHMAGPVKRGPGPAVIVVLLLVALAVGGGIAILVLRPNLPEAPKIEVPQELPISLPWGSKPSEREQAAGDEATVPEAVPADGAVVTGTPADSASAVEGVAVEAQGNGWADTVAEPIPGMPGPEANDPNAAGIGVEGVVGEMGNVEEGETGVPAQPSPDTAGVSEPIVTPEL